MKHVVIIGGGISGLAAAYRIKELNRTAQNPLQLTLLEARPRFGGVIETECRENFLMEGGPDSFISDKPWAYELCKRLGLESEVIGTQEAFRRSFIYEQGKLVPVPNGFYLMAPTRLKILLKMPLLSWFGKLRAACDFFIPPRQTEEDESVANFVRRRLGRETLERIAQPMVGGIYTGDVERLSVQATLPRFFEMERRYGSIVKGLQAKQALENSHEGKASGPRYSLFLTLKGGMARLVDALTCELSDMNLQLSSRVLRIQPGERWKIHLESGEFLEADALCLALPAHQASRLLQPFAQDMASDLAAIPYESAATVNMAFRKQDIPEILNGFGFVVPAREKRKIVGCTFASMKFQNRAPAGAVLLRAFIGGALQREVLEGEDQAIKQMVREELREVLGIEKPPLFISIRHHLQSMPQYYVGHLRLIDAVENKIKNYPGLFLAGNAYHGIGIPDCIRSGEEAAEKMIQFLKQDS